MPPRHLYIHVPFCARRCSYCDFSIAVRRNVPVAAYLNALRIELLKATLADTTSRESAKSADAQPSASDSASALETVYLGGGTPSRLGGQGIQSLLALVREFHELAPDAEVTIEANPDDVSEETVRAWVGAGVNRMSLGVQTFDDAALRWMHRTHSAQQSTDAIRIARRGGIDNVSIDLIFALPEGMTRSWRDDVNRVLELQPAHLSLYGLTVEPFTPLARWASRGSAAIAPDNRYADEFLHADAEMTAAGYMHYEVSNFARDGSRSRHNSAYWSGASYRGAGPSAHSFDGMSRRWNVQPYAEWAAKLEAGGCVVSGEETLTAGNKLAEKVYLGLRTSDGLSVRAADLDIAGSWVKSGWAGLDGAVVRLTPEGWLRLDALAAGLTGI